MLEVHNAKYIFPIPDGLKELSNDIIKEVLRHQPEHINGFIADYLETMLAVREYARDSGGVICDALRNGYFFEELFKKKNVNREQANFYATLIQAFWRGYVVRRKISEWLKKKKKFEEEKERKKSIRIDELLSGLGISYDEAKRAAALIQSAYKESKRGKWIVGETGEFWVGESVPFGQRLREADRVQGRFDRWEKEDFGDFFEMDTTGAIKYVWPKVGQLRKVLRDDVPQDVPVVEFYAMRDQNGKEQYSYLISSQPETEFRGVPIGFVTPLPKSCVLEYSQEVEFVNPENNIRMGHYTYIFRDDIEREDLEKFGGFFKNYDKLDANNETFGELDYDPQCVQPRVLVRIKRDYLLPTDDEVKFVSLPDGVVCEQNNYTFRAETIEQTEKIVRHILRNKCLSVEEGLMEAANMKPYKLQETGRIFPVNKFTYPSNIQKIVITPESETVEDESLDMMRYNYIFLPPEAIYSKKYPPGETTFSISIIRFQGFHSDYRGSADLNDKVFILGPKINTPDGKPFTHESIFWEEFGEEAWFQLLYNLDMFSETFSKMQPDLAETASEQEEEGEQVEVSEIIGEMSTEYEQNQSFQREGETVSNTRKQSIRDETQKSIAGAPEAVSDVGKASTKPPKSPPLTQEENTRRETKQLINAEEETKSAPEPNFEETQQETAEIPPEVTEEKPPEISQENPPEEIQDKPAEESKKKPSEEIEEKPPEEKEESLVKKPEENEESEEKLPEENE